MNGSSPDIRLRIEWCRRMRSKAGTQDQLADWRAEEAGLLDALLGISRLEITRSCHPSRLERYRLGLEDGYTLARLHDGARAQPRSRQPGCDGASPLETSPADARIRSW